MKKIYKNLITSVIISLALLLSSFIIYNNDIPLVEDTVGIFKDYVYKKKSGNYTKQSGISPCFINLSYDQELIDYVVKIDEDVYDTLGSKPYSDRRKLFKLLTELKNTECLYVILDISLDNNIKHPYNDSIVEVLKSMDNVVLVKSSDEKPLCDLVEQKSRSARFTMWDNVMNFSKFELYNDSDETIPLMVYEAITKHKMEKFSLFAIDKGRLAHRCIYPRLYDYLSYDGEKILLGDNYQGEIYNMGVLLNGQENDSDYIKDAVGTNKIVVIGNFDKNEKFDLYQTYVGDLHGSYLIYLVLESLLNEEHIVDYWLFIVGIFVLYIVLFMMILYNITLGSVLNNVNFKRKCSLLPKGNVKKLITFITSFLGYGFLFTLISYLALYFADITFYCSIPTIVFTLFFNIHKSFNYEKS